MSAVYLAAAAAMLLIAVPYVHRIVRGPTVFDRVVALNGIGTKVAVLMVLVGLIHGRPGMFIDMALAFFLLNIITTLLIARYVREKIET